MFTSGDRIRDPLTQEQLDKVHDEAMTVLEEIGTEVRHEAALARLRELGQRVDGVETRRFQKGRVGVVCRHVSCPRAFRAI